MQDAIGDRYIYIKIHYSDLRVNSDVFIKFFKRVLLDLSVEACMCLFFPHFLFLEELLAGLAITGLVVRPSFPAVCLYLWLKLL